MIRRIPISELRGIEDGTGIAISGWVYTVASLGGITFIRLRDSTGIAQVVLKPGSLPQNELDLVKNLGRETSIAVVGTVRKDKRAPGGFEVLA